MDPFYYLKIGRAADLKNPKERFFFRIMEIIPGVFSLGTLLAVVLLSWMQPVWAAMFIIPFVIYWLFRTVYFSFHLSSSYKKMRENEKRDWLALLREMPGDKWRDIYHLIIIPRYQESLEIISEVFASLLKSDYPKDRMIIVLACEERAGSDAHALGANIEREFNDKFFKLLITYHPADLPGEIMGKGANDAWGTRKVKEEIIDHLGIPYENIIVSDFDADTCVYPKYFSCLAHYYLTTDSPTRSSFQPIPLYNNNIWQAPSISRVFAFSATFWQMMCQERSEKLITFSSHSMSFKALVDVDFRQVNVVSDDSRIFWQCFLRYSGDYKVVPMYYPIAMDANVASSFWRTMKNIYKQQRRWAYGAGEIAYFVFGFFKDKKIPLAKEISLTWTIFEGHWSWATTSFVVFFLGWLPVVLGGDEFNRTMLSYNLPLLTSRFLTIAMLGLLGSAYSSLVLLPPRPQIYRRIKYLFFALEWFLLPVIMIFFTALPALDAQTRLLLGKYMGFWATEKSRK
ncbi:MAG: glycosyltransferase family 2 protein [Candidatus Nealsonbacteria bacterium]